MGIRDRTVLEDFIEAYREKLPGFRELHIRDQARLAYMAWIDGSRNRKHSAYEQFTSHTYQSLTRDFGRSRFNTLNAKVNMFEVTHWSQERRFTKGYRLTPEAQRIKTEYLARKSKRPTRLIALNGTAIKKLSKAIAGKDSRGRTAKAWRGVGIVNPVPVDLLRLMALQAALQHDATAEVQL